MEKGHAYLNQAAFPRPASYLEFSGEHAPSEFGMTYRQFLVAVVAAGAASQIRNPERLADYALSVANAVCNALATREAKEIAALAKRDNDR